MTRQFARRLLALAVVALGVLVLGAGPASAHAVLINPQPGFASIVAEAPRVLRLGFSEGVDPTSDSIIVTGPDGRTVPTTVARDPLSDTSLVVGMPPNPPPGTYSVQWRVVGRDGHPTFGEYKFALRAPSASLASSSGQSGAGPTLLGGTGRALSAGGGLALVGLAVFPLLVLRPTRRRLAGAVGEALDEDASRRLRLPVYGAAAVAALGTLLVLADTVGPGTGRSALSQLLHPGRIIELSTATRTGTFLLVRLGAIAVAVALLETLRRRPPAGRRGTLLAAGAALSVGVLVMTFSLSSHAVAEADRFVAIPLDAMHLLAAGIWAGGLLGLALAGLPAARGLARGFDDSVADAAGVLAGRFSVLAQGAMLALLATGGYAALMRITALGDLGSTWGRDLVVKLALWVTLLVVAAGNAFRVVPVLADRAQARTERRAAAGQLASSVRLELGLAAALVVIAGVLSATAPPDQTRPVTAGTTAAPAVTKSQGSGSGYDVAVQAVRTGKGQAVSTVFGVSLTTEGTAASAPEASATLTGPDGVAHGLDLRLVDQGQWSSARLAVRPGQYQMTVQVDRANGAARIPVAVRVG
ncbi:MAG: copper transport protein [Actinomycetota bacterium]|nr:copper transport protein [Actinomycetota bacterium]